MGGEVTFVPSNLFVMMWNLVDRKVVFVMG